MTYASLWFKDGVKMVLFHSGVRKLEFIYKDAYNYSKAL